MATNNDATTTGEEDDLTTCCVCTEVYNNQERKPKCLSCHHTYCITCIKKMARRPPNQVTCPKCKVICILPEKGPEDLFTNDLVLSYIQLKNRVNNQHCWCLECKSIPKVTCEGKHKIIDQMKDVQHIEALQAQIARTYSRAVKKRQQIDQCLQAAIASNSKGLEKLASVARKKAQQWSANKTSAASVKKELKKVLKELEEEDEKADQFWIELNDNSEEKKDLFEPGSSEEGSNAKKRKMTQVDPPVDNNSINRSIGISYERLSSAQPLLCRDIVGHHSNKGVNVVEFSDDSSLFWSGGSDGRVLLWSTHQELAVESPIMVVESVMECNQVREIVCLALSPDNGRIFNGGGKQILIHDVATRKLTYSFQHPNDINGIALKPETNGNQFATASEREILRLFDIRRNSKNAVIELATRPSARYSVMFSPTEASIIAVTSQDDGAVLYDVRNLKSRLNSFSTGFGTVAARFNASGTRLLCCIKTGLTNELTGFNLPTRQQSSTARTTGKIMLTAPDFSNTSVWSEACCFAGLEDDLAISASEDNHLFIWSLPQENDLLHDRTVEQSLSVLRGHKNEIGCVRCSSDKSTIVSCDDGGVIKLWTSGSTR